MPEVTDHYDNLAKRQEKINSWQGQGYHMLHDDFSNPRWKPGDPIAGVLTFANEPEPPPTPEQLQDEANRATCEAYLAKSPSVITQPEIWWLLRYFGKQLGYKAG